MNDKYKIDHFSEKDMHEFIQLHIDVFDAWEESTAREQFEWKYIDNPFLDYIPIMVVKNGGQLVGARGMVAHQMRINQDSILALQGADAMVHPDHRRKGIYSSIYEFFLSEYEKREPRIFFGFPNENALPGHLKFGCEDFELEKYRRYSPTIINTGGQNFSLNGVKDSTLKTAHGITIMSLKKLNDLLIKFYNRGIHVERFNKPPIGILTQIYEKNIVKRLHSKRNQKFYEWRLNEPVNNFKTYISFDKRGEPQCAIITSEQADRIMIREILPIGEERSEKYLHHILSYIVQENGDQYEYSVLTDGQLQTQLLGNGFLPAGYTSTPSGNQNFVVKSLDPSVENIISGVDITNSESWNISFIEMDN